MVAGSTHLGSPVLALRGLALDCQPYCRRNGQWIGGLHKAAEEQAEVHGGLSQREVASGTIRLARTYLALVANVEPSSESARTERGENVTFLILSALLYFLPTIIGRHKADAQGIFLVNLLFGWTVIGWFAALIWACAAERYAPVRFVPVSSGRFCCQCGSVGPAGAHFCWACGRTV